LSKGYYCSLLAEARKHQVLPSVKTINALRSGQAPMHNVGQIDGALYFGNATNDEQTKAAKSVFKQYPAPIYPNAMAYYCGATSFSLGHGNTC